MIFKWKVYWKFMWIYRELYWIFKYHKKRSIENYLKIIEKKETI